MRRRSPMRQSGGGCSQPCSAWPKHPWGDREAALNARAAPACQWRVSHPMNEMAGNAAALAQVWGPLRTAMPDQERRDTVFVAGVSQGRTLIAATGHYCGTMTGDWLGIPATGKTV